jgi:phosphatidylserine/phosphatidylglycerophosphate/cardiolipin synthase-like enzyme
MAMLLALQDQKKRAPGGPDQIQIGVFQPQPRMNHDMTANSWPASLHAKMGISDNLVGWVGSQNLTDNSKGYYEAITVVRYEPAIKKQLETFQSWWKLCVPFNPREELKARTAATKKDR